MCIEVVVLYSQNPNLKFYDEYNEFFLLNSSITLNNVFGKTISIMPFPQAKAKSSKGLLYPLDNTDLELGNFLGIRNQAISDTVEIKFSHGTALLFISI